MMTQGEGIVCFAEVGNIGGRMLSIYANAMRIRVQVKVRLR